MLAAGYVDCYRATHPTSPSYTSPAATPWLRLDYFFASLVLADRLIDSGVIDGKAVARALDHLPVWAAFREEGDPLPQMAEERKG